LTGLLAAIICLAAADASARVGPPVEVELLGPPRAAKAGEVFSGELLVESGEDAVLEHCRLAGEGWRQERLDVAAAIRLPKDGSLVIGFSVEPRDPNEPLVFKFDWNGVAVERSYDLSAATYELALAPTPTVKLAGRDGVPQPPDPGHTVFMPVEPVAAWNDNARLKPGTCDVGHVGDRPGADDDGKGTREYTLTVQGRFICVRSDGQEVPGDGMLVQIYDADPGIDDLLATTMTTSDGYFGCTWHDTQSEDPDIYVIFSTENATIETEHPTGWIVYAFETGEWPNVTDPVLDIGTHMSSDDSLHRAVFVHTSITRTARWFEDRGYGCGFVDVRWPNEEGETYYQRVGDNIYIGRDRSWEEGVHSHEYGHHFQDQYEGLENINYCNGICDESGTDCAHCIWCEEDVVIAWQEGVANWIGNVIPKTYTQAYGLWPLYFVGVDSLFTCQEDGTYHNESQTEGYTAALLVDIQDEDEDDHSEYPGVHDELWLGSEAILYLIDQAEPGSMGAFLEDFRYEWPVYREQLWATAMNCGYQTDDAQPLPPASIWSTSHTAGVGSPNAIVELAWERAIDDASGIEGYGYVVSAGAPVMPTDFMALEDVTTHTLPPLEAGSWYFNLRSLDRDGNWGGSYTSFGPIVIEEPDPANFSFYEQQDWQYSVVPRDDEDATGAAAVVSTTLPGGEVGTYWSVLAQNDGEEAATEDMYASIYVDEEYKGQTYWLEPYAGEQMDSTNNGPFSSYGGRHSLHCELDAQHLMPEPDELDNYWGRQFVWTPREMVQGTLYAQPAPSTISAGYGFLTEGPFFYNCHGWRFESSGWWNAVAVWAVENDEDFDQRLHAPTTGAEDGFDTPLATSARLAGCLDAVLVNRNTLGNEPWDVSVMNFVGTGTHQYYIQHIQSSSHDYGDSVTVTMPAGQHILLAEFEVYEHEIGTTSVSVSTDPPLMPLYVQWRARDFTYGSLTDFDAETVTDLDGKAHLSCNIAMAGYHCLAFYRDPLSGSEAMEITFEIQATTADLRPFHAWDWHSPLVPRPAPDGTPASVALPDTLHGNEASTYFNMTFWNASPSDGGAMLNHVLLDDEVTSTPYYTTFPAWHYEYLNWPVAKTVRGGRHTLVHVIDADALVEEMDETNNVYGEQYIWSPLALAPHEAATRAPPPARMGGWTQIGSGEEMWFNCDGLRMDVNSRYWIALAVMPGDTSDVDVRIHQPLVGAKDGFHENEVMSAWGRGQSDYVLLNFNLVDRHDYDVGVVNAGGEQDYTIQCVDEDWLGQPDGTYGPFTLSAGEILHLYEMYLTPETYEFRLENLAGSVDWGMSFHTSVLGYHQKTANPFGPTIWLNGPGEGETLPVEVDSAGYYCLAVWKAGTADLGLDGQYELEIGLYVTDVDPPEGLPSLTALRSIYPNPFNPQTTIAFDLAVPGAVDVAVYDLTGARVRLLDERTYPAGRHSLVWDGRDDAGVRVASGMYLLRLKAGGEVWSRRITPVK